VQQPEYNTRKIGKIVKIDEGRLNDHNGQLVKQLVEDTLNALLESETYEQCKASRYARLTDRVSTRSNHYARGL
jgi:hypothetical protein